MKETKTVRITSFHYYYEASLKYSKFSTLRTDLGSIRTGSAIGFAGVANE